MDEMDGKAGHIERGMFAPLFSLLKEIIQVFSILLFLSFEYALYDLLEV